KNIYPAYKPIKPWPQRPSTKLFSRKPFSGRHRNPPREVPAKPHPVQRSAYPHSMEPTFRTLRTPNTKFPTAPALRELRSRFCIYLKVLVLDGFSFPSFNWSSNL